MAAGLPNILLFNTVAAVVDRADAVTMRGAEPSHLPLFFDGGLEDEDPLLHHTLFSGGERIGVLWRGSGSRLDGCVGREVVQGGLDLRVLLRGGGVELV